MRLQDRVVLITGGSSGLGHALVARFAEEGARVVIADIAERPTRSAASDVGSDGRVVFRQTDVRDAASVDAAVAYAVDRFGRLDVLVNNAAVFTTLERKPLDEITEREWDEVFAVNVTGVFHGIRAASARMKATGGGKIINIGSDVVFKGLPMLLHYVASKGAVLAMTRAAARELGRDGICVNAVAPGYMRHPDFPAFDEDRDRQLMSMRSIARSQTPQDVVGAVLFLASSDSDFITGQTLVVDGGEVLH